MIFAKLAIALGAISCAGTPALSATRHEPQPDARHLPAVSGPLTFAPEQAVNLRELIDNLGELTGMGFLIDSQTAQVLEATPLALGVTRTVPANEVYSFVEGIVSFHGIYFGLVKSGACPLMGVYARQSRNPIPRLPIAASEIDEFASHSALMVSATLSLKHLDARQVATTMRALLTDTSTQTLLPVGIDGMVVRGTGAWVASLAGLLRDADAAAQPSPGTPEPAAPANQAGA